LKNNQLESQCRASLSLKHQVLSGGTCDDDEYEEWDHDVGHEGVEGPVNPANQTFQLQFQIVYQFHIFRLIPIFY